MATTYTLISSTTVGSGGVSDITLSSIPATYSDLCILLSLRSGRNEVADNLRCQLNGDTNSGNYEYVQLYGTSGSITTTKSNGTQNFTRVGIMNSATSTSSIFSNLTIYIPEYTSSYYKTFSSLTANENNESGADKYVQSTINLWRSTSAITSIKLFSENSATILQHGTVHLYGISNA
jgi:hypothetical protein